MLAAAFIVVTLLPGPNEDLRAQAQRIVEREGLQTSLAFDPQESAARPATSSAPLPPRRPGRDDPEPQDDRPWRSTRDEVDLPSGSSGAWARALLWVLGGALLVGLVVALVATLRRPKGAAAGLTPPAPPEVEAHLPRAALGRAEVLAAEGRYAEAVHRLLFDALALLAAREPEPVPDHLTSREVLARLHLGAAPRAALAWLVDAVEISHFGGRALDRQAWEEAHAAFSRLSGAA